ncbi:hypothetical protein EhV18_00165 [Emiliania huxleyi virus 18]|nr:hypothetical protein EhV18_00165 [Emiliania huxleyi virus 18]AHA55263.1 hypothetical protein EhV156_00167 [Emiliania huxleyi virus 156]
MLALLVATDRAAICVIRSLSSTRIDLSSPIGSPTSGSRAVNSVPNFTDTSISLFNGYSGSLFPFLRLVF